MLGTGVGKSRGLNLVELRNTSANTRAWNWSSFTCQRRFWKKGTARTKAWKYNTEKGLQLDSWGVQSIQGDQRHPGSMWSEDRREQTTEIFHHLTPKHKISLSLGFWEKHPLEENLGPSVPGHTAQSSCWVWQRRVWGKSADSLAMFGGKMTINRQDCGWTNQRFCCHGNRMTGQP